MLMPETVSRAVSVCSSPDIGERQVLQPLDRRRSDHPAFCTVAVQLL